MLDLSVLDSAELSSLTKAMHEARFPEVCDDPIVWLSPFVIDLHVAAIQESRRRIAQRGDAGQLKNFDNWLNRAERPEYVIFKARMSEDEWLQRKVYDEREKFLRWALRPFVVSEGVVDELVVHAAKLLANAGHQS